MTLTKLERGLPLADRWRRWDDGTRLQTSARRAGLIEAALWKSPSQCDQQL